MAKETGFNLWDAVLHARNEPPEEQQAPPEEMETFPKATTPEKPKWLKQTPQPPKPREDVILEQARTKMTKNLRSEDEAAIKLLQTIPGWKDADQLLAQCQKSLKERDIKEAEARRRQQREVAAERRKLFIGLTVGVLALLLVIGGLGTAMYFNGPAYAAFQKEAKYKKALELKKANKYEEAFSLFYELGDYKESIKHKESMCYLDGSLIDPTAPTLSVQPGDILLFGKYAQGASSGVRTPLKWQVLEVQENMVLVISCKVLERKAYDIGNTEANWEKSWVRRWLNEDFYQAAFSEKERELIYERSVESRKYTDLIPNGENTWDKLFLLDIEEANRYFPTDESRKAEVTTYGKKTGVTENRWWLRTMGRNSFDAIYVNEDGAISMLGRRVDTDGLGVRPAMWIDWRKLPPSYVVTE